MTVEADDRICGAPIRRAACTWFPPWHLPSLLNLPICMGSFPTSNRNMPHLLFKWVLREDRYEFSGQAKTPRALEAEVDAEIIAIWAWVQRQKLRTYP